ncbi:hypothetical protein N7462_000120 [Penicillium macrosclerotiorum]|uniref:uncharacterized protein n=1 Tax=Penicillium macrosclerotiorum TaxID=303699 RepID=UPI0025497462|nr:uncharacterized protein N7462_000120 [Penicillium macrosclerotiorum]KAJ5698115.1 hypothetical protein N7462_000120 [Penicillium macrosclerotiorum]
MSMETTNTASLSGYHSFLKSINASNFKIPLHNLRELFLHIQRFSAMAIIFAYHPDSQTELRIAHGAAHESRQEVVQTIRAGPYWILRHVKAERHKSGRQDSPGWLTCVISTTRTERLAIW